MTTLVSPAPLYTSDNVDDPIDASVGNSCSRNDEAAEFAYRVSHDLREPLRTIDNYLKLLRRRSADKLGESETGFIDSALAGSDQLREMLEGLLNYSRINDRGGDIVPTETETCLDAVKGRFQRRVEEVGGSLKIKGAFVAVLADPRQLVTLFNRVVENSIQFRSPERPLEILITGSESNKTATFTIQDNGLGIAPTEHERAFDVFYRFHRDRSTASAGMGLPTAKRIANRFGGDLFIAKSVENEMTTMQLNLTAI